MSVTSETRTETRADAQSARPWAAALAGLHKAYGAPRRTEGRKKLDLVMLAVLAEDRGERTANRWIEDLYRHFVDWNEVRVARMRDLSAAATDMPAERLARMQALLQGMYELVGGLDVSGLVAAKPSEARAWLVRLDVLDREEIEAVLLIALGVPTLPAGEGLVRAVRRFGLAPRKATRPQAQKLAEHGLAEDDYREFYSLISEHAALRCRETKPDCERCKLRAQCKSRGKW
jgi:endonuclease III